MKAVAAPSVLIVDAITQLARANFTSAGRGSSMSYCAHRVHREVTMTFKYEPNACHHWTVREVNLSSRNTFEYIGIHILYTSVYPEFSRMIS